MISHLVLLVLLSWWWATALLAQADSPSESPRQSLLTRTRVVIVEDARAVLAFDPAPDRVQQMVDKGLITLTCKSTPAAAWRSLVSTQDIIGIKVYSAPGATSGTRPVVAAAVVKSLLAAGFQAKQIILWDKHLIDLRRAGFLDLAERYGVRVTASADAGYDEKAFYDSALLGTLVWGDFEFGKKGENVGRKSFVSKLLTQRITKIINITPLLNQTQAQVAGNLYSLALGSVDNTLRFEAPLNQLGQAVPEIYALPDIGDRVALNIVDALICQYQGEERTFLHYSTMLNQLRFGTNPVALDVLSIQELDRQRQAARIPPVKVSWQIYTNAAFLDLGTSDPRLIDVIKVQSGDKE